jgi:DNA-binding NarL/FixJ family response regulator
MVDHARLAPGALSPTATTDWRASDIMLQETYNSQRNGTAKVSEPHRADVRIFLVSTRSLYSELLEYALLEKVCDTCEIVTDLSKLISQLARNPESAGGCAAAQGKTVLLVDCIENDFDQVVNTLSDHEVEPSEELIVAIYNVYSGWGIEEEALKYGIRGFFYKQDSMKLLLKGINAILRKEIWASREILMRSAMEGIRQKQSSIQEKTGLSIREMEILRLILSGSPNEDIAQKLFISPNTVRTHLYHIYRKINVSNRLGASIWAANNL